MGVLGAALEVDVRADVGGGGHAVVAAHLEGVLLVAQAEFADLAEVVADPARPVAGGVDKEVRAEGLALPRRQELHGHPDAVRALLHLAQPGDVHHPQPFPALHLLLVHGPRQRLDQIHVHDGVVGAAVVVEQRLLHLTGRAVVQVDGLGIEDLVGEGAVIGGRVAVLGEDGADLGLGEAAVEVVHGLRRALSGAQDDGAAYRPAGAPGLLDAGQQLAGVPHTVGQDGVRREVRLQSGGDADAAGAADGEPVRVAGGTAGDVEVADLSVPADGAYGDDLGGVLDEVGDAGGGPREVVVELDAQREEGLQVEEVDQPALVAQVAQEAEVAGGVTHRHQVLEEGHLHGGVVDEHAAVPSEAGLSLQESDPRSVLRAGPCGVLVERDGEREIRRAESDPQYVVDGIRPGVQHRHRVIAFHREKGSTQSPRQEHRLPQHGHVR